VAATATQQVIHNGPRNLVLKYTIGGTTGDASAEQLLDLSSVDSSVGIGRLRLEKAAWAMTGLSCKLSWDAAPDVDLIEMSDGSGEVDFSRFGGVVNSGEDQTGDVLFTTTNYTASGDGGHFTLWFKKRLASAILQDISPLAGSAAIAGLAPEINLLLNPGVGAAQLTGLQPDRTELP